MVHIEYPEHTHTHMDRSYISPEKGPHILAGATVVHADSPRIAPILVAVLFSAIPEGVNAKWKAVQFDGELTSDDLDVVKHTLEEITVPASVTRVYAQTFYRFTHLQCVVFEGVTRIGSAALSETHSLKSVSLPKTLVTLDMAVFYGSGIESIVLPEGLESIGIECFAHTSFLKEIVVPSSLRHIDTGSFLASAIVSIIIPKGVTRIGVQSFSLCRALESVVIHAQIRQLAANMFYNCIALTNVVLPPSLVCLGDRVFDRCMSLVSVTLPEGLLHIGRGILDRTCITHLVIPSTVIQIHPYAFQYMLELKKLVLPSRFMGIRVLVPDLVSIIYRDDDDKSVPANNNHLICECHL